MLGHCTPVWRASLRMCKCSDTSLLQELWGMHFSKISDALHRWWTTAHLYEEQISIGVIAETQGHCEPVLRVLKSSPELRGMHFAKTSEAVHWWWVIAHLYEQRSSNHHRCDCSDTQPCCVPVLPSSTEQWEMHLPRPALQCISVGSLHTCMKSKSLQV